MMIAGTLASAALTSAAIAGRLPNPPAPPNAPGGPLAYVPLGGVIAAGDPQANGQFGWSVAIDRDTAVVGAWLEDTDRGHNAGAAYIFRWTGGTWAQVAKVTAPDGATEDRFGQAVAVYGDVVVIGACMADLPGAVDSGAAYVFRRDGGEWGYEAKLVAADPGRTDQFSRHIAMSDLGVAISAPREERAGGMDQGAVYMFERHGGVWVQKAKLIAQSPGSGDSFGFRLAMDDSTLAVGSQYNDAPHQPDALYDAGAVDIFNYQGGQWVHTQLLRPSDVVTGANFGSSLALGSGLLVVGAERATTSAVRGGAAYVFGRNASGLWEQTARLVSPQPAAEDFFGSTVAISGPTIVIAAEKADLGAVDAGSVQSFRYSTLAQRWVGGAPFNSGINQVGAVFGTDIAFSHGLLLASAPMVNLPGATVAGAAFAFTTGEDCNGDGMGDVSQIVVGKLDDVNANGIPDVCECLADWDRSGEITSTDISAFINDWFLDQETGTLNADVDANGMSNTGDVSAFINAYFGGCV